MTTNRFVRLLGPLAGCLLAAAGCATDGWGPAPPDPRMVAGAGASYSLGSPKSWFNFLFKPPDAPPPPPVTLTLNSVGLQPDKKPVAERGEVLLAGGRELFRREDYPGAEKVFHYIANDEDHYPTSVVQEAIYYEAECLRLQGSYPKACDTYNKLVEKHPQSPLIDQATKHMFDIADYWLDDTRAEMREERERKAGKRWVVWPRFISFEKSKPLVDREGRALQALEHVRMGDYKGPLADKALFMAGCVMLYHENYREADDQFSAILKDHKDSPYATQALEYAIWCKHMSTGGADYDGIQVAKARQMVDLALRDQTLAAKRQEFLVKQLQAIDRQQAEKDFKMAEFYRRTGHPGSAYFYYELVRRRYPHTSYEKEATARKKELEVELAKTRGQEEPKPLPLGAPGSPSQPAPTPQTMPGAPGRLPGGLGN